MYIIVNAEEEREKQSAKRNVGFKFFLLLDYLLLLPPVKLDLIL